MTSQETARYKREVARMPKHYISAKAVCPYYKHEDSQLIYCLGVDDSTTLHLAFADAREAKEYKSTYCYGKPRKCIICRALEEAWEVE